MSETRRNRANGESQRTDAAWQSEVVGDRPEAAKLPRLLAETTDSLGAADGAEPWHAALTAEDRERLTRVAQRRGASAMLDLATAADLVEAVLPEALASLASDPVSRRRLMERIAQSLLDDPQCTDRLRSLVGALQSTVRQADDGQGSGGARS